MTRFTRCAYFPVISICPAQHAADIQHTIVKTVVSGMHHGLRRWPWQQMSPSYLRSVHMRIRQHLLGGSKWADWTIYRAAPHAIKER